MQFTVAPSLQQAPVRLGWIVYRDVTIGPSPQMVSGRLRLFQEQFFFEWDGRSLREEEPFCTLDEHVSSFEQTPFFQTIDAIAHESWQTPSHSADDLTLLFNLQLRHPVIARPIETAPHVISEQILAEPLSTVQEHDASLVQLFFLPNVWSEEQQRAFLRQAGQFFFQIHGGTFEGYLSTGKTSFVTIDER